MKPNWQQQQPRDQMRREEQQPQPAGVKSGERPDGSSQGPFATAMLQADFLRQELIAGRISEKQYKERMSALMFQDARGNWWMVGAISGDWYRHDGSNWVREDPFPVPNRNNQIPASGGLAKGEAASNKPAAEGNRRLGSLVLLVGLIVTAVVGFWVGGAVHELTYTDTYAISCASAVWITGLIISVLQARKIAAR